MGLFDNLAKNIIGGAVGGGVKNSLLQDAIGLLSNSQSGRLAGLLQQFAGKGLGDAASSWVGTGKNLPVSGEQIMSVLGHDHVRELARKTGAAPNEVADGLANILPEVVDTLTPDGKIPDGDALEQGLGALKKLFGGL